MTKICFSINLIVIFNVAFAQSDSLWKDYHIQTSSIDVYNKVKRDIALDKTLLKQAYENGEVTLDSIGQYFEEKLVNEIIPHWYGTTWGFEGHTSIPNNGEIACGYLVSTTLKHMGLNINRYRMAQQYSLKEVQVLARGDSVYTFNDASTVVSNIKENLKEGLYVVGLSSHVGFILKRKGEVFFIHSSYLEPVAVAIEIASVSEAFIYSDLFYFAGVTTNHALLKKWLYSKEIKVVP